MDLPEAWVALGVDVGGTKIEAAVLKGRRDDFEVLVRERVPTDQSDGYEAIVDRAAGLARRSVELAGVSLKAVAVGVGMPGGIVRRSGVVKNSNTACLNGRPFRQDLTRALGRSAAFDNDANCFAIAETRLGAARPFASGIVFGVILGTGVGGGLVVRGEVWPGLQGIAGEWGHHAVFAGAPDARACYCGQRGCLERYASGPAVEEAFAAISGRRLDLPEIAALRGDDRHAALAIDGLLDAVGRGLANVVDVLDPSAIVLGGGVSNLPLLYTEGRERVARYVFNDELLTPIVQNELGDSAGVFGAALLGLTCAT